MNAVTNRRQTEDEVAGAAGAEPMRHSSRAKRVLFFSTSVGGGAARVLADIVQHLDSSAFECCVAVRGSVQDGPLAELRTAGFTVYECKQPTAWQQSSGRRRMAENDGEARFTRRSLRQERPILAGLRSAYHGLRHDWPVYRQLRRFIESFKPDVVWLNGFGGNVGLAYLLRTQRIPVLVHCHMTTRLTWFHRRAAAGVTRFVCISRTVADTLHSVQRPIAILPNAVDVSRIADVPGAMQRLRQELGLAGERRIVSIVGRLVPWKGQDDFLRALNQVRNMCPGVLGLIIGESDGTRESEAFVNRLRRLATELGLEEHVRWLGHRDDIATVYAVSEVVVLSSKMPEPFGLVIIEAMAAGCPVVATAAGGPSEIIEDRKTGLLVPTASPEALARAILELLENRPLADSIARAGQNAVEKRFSMRAHAAGVAKIIAEAATAGTQHGGGGSASKASEAADRGARREAPV